MKRKLVLIFGFAGALTLSFGFAKDLQSTKIFGKTEQLKVKDEYNVDQNSVISVEEQNRREGNVARGKNVITTISVEEQNMVENSPAQQGFVPQENRTGFFFTKIN